MRHPVKALMAELRRTAQASREAVAAKLYGQESLRAAMVAAAGTGFETVTIGGPDGLDLRETPAAVASLAWLAGEKLTARWDQRNVPGIAGSTFDLVVSWTAPAVPA